MENEGTGERRPHVAVQEPGTARKGQGERWTQEEGQKPWRTRRREDEAGVGVMAGGREEGRQMGEASDGRGSGIGWERESEEGEGGERERERRSKLRRRVCAPAGGGADPPGSWPSLGASLTLFPGSSPSRQVAQGLFLAVQIPELKALGSACHTLSQSGATVSPRVACPLPQAPVCQCREDGAVTT